MHQAAEPQGLSQIQAFADHGCDDSRIRYVPHQNRPDYPITAHDQLAVVSGGVRNGSSATTAIVMWGRNHPDRGYRKVGSVHDLHSEAARMGRSPWGHVVPGNPALKDGFKPGTAYRMFLGVEQVGTFGDITGSKHILDAGLHEPIHQNAAVDEGLQQQETYSAGADEKRAPAVLKLLGNSASILGPLALRPRER